MMLIISAAEGLSIMTTNLPESHEPMYSLELSAPLRRPAVSAAALLLQSVELAYRRLGPIEELVAGMNRREVGVDHRKFLGQWRHTPLLNRSQVELLTR